MLDFSRCRTIPYAHQIDGVEHLISHPAFALFDEMGVGKSYQTILAAQILYEQNLIDRVIVITPSSVRAVWYDPELGELAKHLWENIPARIAEYHSRIRVWTHGPEVKPNDRTMRWTITNYDFIRDKLRRADLLKACSERA